MKGFGILYNKMNRYLQNIFCTKYYLQKIFTKNFCTKMPAPPSLLTVDQYLHIRWKVSASSTRKWRFFKIYFLNFDWIFEKLWSLLLFLWYWRYNDILHIRLMGWMSSTRNLNISEKIGIFAYSYFIIDGQMMVDIAGKST